MIEKRLRDKIDKLIRTSRTRADASRDTEEGLAEARAWIAEAHNVVTLALPDVLQTYRREIDRAAISSRTVSQHVLTVAAILRSLLTDFDGGLVATITNAIRAETFDNFLDHAIEYQKEGRKDEAGVIAGVVFEDTIRKIYADKIDKVKRPDLEQVIISLTKSETITEEEAKQARVAAHVRTKATHAEWDDFTTQGVIDTIRLTKSLLKQHLT